MTGGIGERSRRAASGAEAGPSGRRDPADVDSSDRAPADEDRADRAPATVGAALCAGAARLAASARWQRGDLDAADAKGDARAPKYRKVAGVGSVDAIRDRLFAALQS